jgi:peptidoglycan-associated lipoprotein
LRAQWIVLSGGFSLLLLLAGCGGPEGGPAPVTMGGPGFPGGPGASAGYGPGGIESSQLGSAAAQQRDLALVAGDRVFFAYDSSDISPDAQQILARQAEWLKRYAGVRVVIEGHTDERGTREYNLSLGERRAGVVKNVLVALGIEPSRISTISYGKERPEVPHSDEESFAQNRRAVTVVQ